MAGVKGGLDVGVHFGPDVADVVAFGAVILAVLQLVCEGKGEQGEGERWVPR